MSLNGLVLLISALTLIPILESDEKERVVGVLCEAQQAEADDGSAALDAGRFQQSVLYLRGRLLGALQRRSLRQHQCHIEIALVFIRDKGCGKPRAYQSSGGGHDRQERQAESRLSDQHGAKAYVSVGRLGKTAIESLEEPSQGPLIFCLRLQ